MKKLPYFVCLFFLLLPGLLSAQSIISTIAGTGLVGYSGDGGLATAAKLNTPWGLFADNSGNIYFSEDGNYTIRKINSSGIITTIAGTGTPGYSGDGGQATAAKINHAGQIIVNGAGTIFFADSYNNCIRKIDTSGVISTIAGNGIGGFSGDGGPATTCQLNNPLGLVFDNGGNMYVADYNNNRIRKISTAGIISTYGGTGVAGYSGDGVQATSSKLNHPNALIIDTSGNLYITDNANHRIRKINTSGIIITVAGDGIGGFSGDGGSAIAAHIYFPAGMALDFWGNLYICDHLNSRIRVVNTSGIINTFAGTGISGFSGDGGPPTSAKLNNPTYIFIDNYNNSYICDYHNSRIRKIAPPNSAPTFINGNINTHLCGSGIISLDTFLKVIDSNIGQTITWGLLAPPLHGMASIAYSTTSTGSVLSPVGLTYSPNPGYFGVDSLKVSVTDGIATSNLTIRIDIDSLPSAGIISGTDSVCPGYSVALTETRGGGIWSSSNISVSTVSTSGIVTGINPGVDTIIYTVVTDCGVVSAIFPFIVSSWGFCHTGIGFVNSPNELIAIYPNPFTGSFCIKPDITQNTPVKIHITDLLGRSLLEFTDLSGDQLSVNMQDYPSGVYIVFMSSGTNTYTARVIKE